MTEQQFLDKVKNFQKEITKDVDDNKLDIHIFMTMGVNMKHSIEGTSFVHTGGKELGYMLKRLVAEDPEILSVFKLVCNIAETEGKINEVRDLLNKLKPQGEA